MRRRRTRGRRANRGAEGKLHPTRVACEHDPGLSHVQDPCMPHLLCATRASSHMRDGMRRWHVKGGASRGLACGPTWGHAHTLPSVVRLLAARVAEQQRKGAHVIWRMRAPPFVLQKRGTQLGHARPTLRTLPFVQARGIGGTAPLPPHVPPLRLAPPLTSCVCPHVPAHSGNTTPSHHLPVPPPLCTRDKPDARGPGMPSACASASTHCTAPTCTGPCECGRGG